MHALNFERIINSNLSSLVRMTAREVQVATYIPFGKWCKNVSQSDLDRLLQLGELLAHESDPASAAAYPEMIIMTELLSLADGLAPEDEYQLFGFLGYFVGTLNCVSLERKGVVKIDYTKLSFGAELTDAVSLEQ